MQSGDDLVNYWLAELTPPLWKKFVYISEASDDRVAPTRQPDRLRDTVDSPFRSGLCPLSTCRVGDRVRIVTLNCGESNNRLMGMGFMPDVVLEVISCTATGSVIVALQDQRLGLGAEMAQRIQVMDANQMLENHPPQPTAGPSSAQLPQTQPPVKLRDVAIGSRLKVVGYEPAARDYKRKLLAMGLTPGTELEVKRHAPLGDPTEIEVRGFHLSLRKDEANALIVEPI